MTQKHETNAVRRMQIMEAAGKIIVRRGSEHVTIKDIAQEVGISEAAIYRHFRRKKDVLLLLVDYIGDSLASDIETATSRGNPSFETLEAVLKSHISAIERRRGISFQVIAEIISLGDKELNARAFETMQKYITSLEELLTNATKEGKLQGNLDFKAMAMLISAMIQGLVNIWVLSNYSIDLKKEFTTAWKILFEGIVNHLT